MKKDTSLKRKANSSKSNPSISNLAQGSKRLTKHKNSQKNRNGCQNRIRPVCGTVIEEFPFLNENMLRALESFLKRLGIDYSVHYCTNSRDRVKLNNLVVKYSGESIPELSGFSKAKANSETSNQSGEDLVW